MGLFTIFGTSLRALNAYSGAMGVVANNIANSSNENYSRQRVEFETLPPDNIGGFETGRGISLASISQIVNGVIEQRLNESTQDLGEDEAKAEYLSSIENIFNEVSGNGLSDSIAQFFNSWTAASAEPENLTVRQNVLNAATNMIDIFHTYSAALANARTSVDLEIKNAIPEVNNVLTQIADLNQKIVDSETDALSLRDERRRLINELGEYIDVTYLESGDQMQVYTTSGLPLVNNSNVATLSTVVDVTNDNLVDIYYSIGGSAAADISDQIQSGRLKGLIAARDTHAGAYQNRLDDLAYTVATQINTQHSAGYNLSGNTGINFFTAFAVVAPVYSDAARLISLDATVSTTPSALALSSNAADIPGGNGVALNIAALYDSTSIAFGAGTTNSFMGHWGDLLATVGNDTALAQSNLDFTQSVLDQINLERTQESGVNVDEEQINLIKFQAAYEASGRMIKIADSILETLINALVS